LLLKPVMFDKDTMQIYISEMKGWIFKQGNDTAWSKKDIDLTGWKRLMPTELSENLADKNGRVEGWFRIKIKLDTALGETPFGFRISSWVASDFYINGNWIASFGNTGLNRAPYLENKFVSNLLPVPVNIKPGNEYTLALHVVDYLSPFPPHQLKSKESGLRSLLRITVPKYYKTVVSDSTSGVYFNIIFTIISAVLSLLFWLLFFQNRSEKNLLLFALASTFLTIGLIGSPLSNNRGASYGGISYVWLWVYQQISTLFVLLFFIILPYVLASIFKRRVSRILKTIFILLLIFNLNGIIQIYDLGEKIGVVFLLISFSLIIITSIYYVVSSWKTLKGAQWSIVVGLMLMLSIFLFLVIFQLIYSGAQFHMQRYSLQ
jgi:two-component system, NtrC family, sensor kinase